MVNNKHITTQQAARLVVDLYSIWVGKIPEQITDTHIQRIESSIRSEMRANKQIPARATEANKRETRYHAILLGKARKALRERD